MTLKGLLNRWGQTAQNRERHHVTRADHMAIDIAVGEISRRYTRGLDGDSIRAMCGKPFLSFVLGGYGSDSADVASRLGKDQRLKTSQSVIEAINAFVLSVADYEADLTRSGDPMTHIYWRLRPQIEWQPESGTVTVRARLVIGGPPLA